MEGFQIQIDLIILGGKEASEQVGDIKKKSLFKVWGRGFSMVSLFLKQVEVNGVLFFNI